METIYLILSVLLNILASLYIFKNINIVKLLNSKILKLENDNLKNSEIKIGVKALFCTNIFVQYGNQDCVFEVVISGTAHNKAKIRVTNVVSKEGLKDEYKKNIISKFDGTWVEIEKLETCEISDRDYKIEKILNGNE